MIFKQAAQQVSPARGDDFHGDGLAAINQRLDDLTRRVEQMMRSGPEAYAPRRGDPAPANNLVENFDRRMERFAQASRPPPPLAPTPNVQLPPGLDQAVAEIAARQRALNGEPAAAPPRPQPQPHFQPQPQPFAQAPIAPTAPVAPPAQPATPASAATPAPTPAAAPAPLPTQDLSGLEDQLRRITDQIETLRTPGVEEAINALRGELVEIGNALNEAMPRREIDAIEKQIAGLTQRIADGRQNGNDHGALAGIEQGLAEVRDALRSLTPAEQLVGFHEAIEGLAHKIDLIVAQKDPETMAQLENAINTLRSMAPNIASNETISALAAQVHTLGEKVDYIAHATAGGSGSALDNLEHRISAIADALSERAQNGGAVPPQLEALVHSLSDKIEQLQSSRSDDVAIGHLEDRIVKLVEKLDASESRLGQLEAIERGLGDLLVHIEDLRANRQTSGLRADASPAVDELKHDIARTQDAVDSVHGTLALVVDRLAKIEGDIRAGRAAVAEDAAPVPPVGKLAVRAVSDAPPTMPLASEPPRMPQAAPLQMPEPQIGAQPQFAPQPEPEPAPPPPMPEAAPLELQESQVHEPPPPPPRRRVASALPLYPDLPPDQPLEPGSGPPKFGARIAASEAALGDAAPQPPGTAGGKSSFIAAARRAAKAALQQGQHTPVEPGEPEEADTSERRSLPGKLMKRMKSMFVAAGIIGLVAGGAQILGSKLNLGGGTHTAKTGKLETDKRAKLAHEAIRAPQVQIGLSPVPDPMTTSAIPPLAAPAPKSAPAYNLGIPGNASSLLNPPNLGAPATAAQGDITGSIAHNVTPPASARRSGLDGADLPHAIGSARLRSAAVAGNAAAQYEVGARFAEGRGVPANLKKAARWFERAAGKGLAPAQFRYASMLEKGQGVKKDLAAARRLYRAAAARGNAKAMHNLAVLYAEGIDGKPDYATAVKWFRKAAQHGIADSQYNLGILTARGLGTAPDFVESYKWFALAGARGDAESVKKRDEVASRLDPAQLAAAQQAVKTFKPEPQPAVATVVPKPHGGWGSAGAAPAAKPKAQSQPHRQQQQQRHAPLSLGSFTVGQR